MDQTEDLTIRQFEPADQEEVKVMILAGLDEHWGTLDPLKNPDLNDIAASYAAATFLVAWMDGRIVGTGVLIPREEGIAEIVRMSVARQMRRKGIASRILRELIRKAKELGFHTIILETTDTWNDAIEFYKCSGFRITHYKDGDVYFRMELQGQPNRPEG